MIRHGTAGDRRITELLDAGLHVVLREHGQRRFSVAFEERCRRACRREQEMFGVEHDIGKALFAEGRHFRQIDPARFGGDGQPAHDAGLDLRLRARQSRQQ